MSNAIEIKGLVKRYDGFALDDVDITLPSGYIMGMIGENGAGKTTTIKALTGLVKPDGGSIKVLGEDIENGDRQLREHIGVVTEDHGLPSELSAANVGAVMKRIYRTWDSESFRARVKSFGLPARKKIKDYSRGMKVRLSIAIALSHDSRLLIMDEVTAGLDPAARDELLDVLRDFIQDEEHSVFISSHILSDLEKICDYITFIHKGRVIFSGEKDALTEMYGIARCGKDELENIPHDAVAAVRESGFGVEALVRRDMVNPALITDDATLEDIMVMTVKEDER